MLLIQTDPNICYIKSNDTGSKKELRIPLKDPVGKKRELFKCKCKLRLRKFYYHFRVALSSWAGEMEVEGRETYTNRITIGDFMIELNETRPKLAFRSFLKCQLLRGLPWTTCFENYTPFPILPYSTTSPSTLPHSTITVQRIITYFTYYLSLLECQLQVRGFVCFVWCCIPSVCATYQVLKKQT